jgi:hypothetical protein
MRWLLQRHVRFSSVFLSHPSLGKPVLEEPLAHVWEGFVGSTDEQQLFHLLPHGLARPWVEKGHPPRGQVRVGGVLTTANSAGTNGLTCFPKHGRARGNQFLVTHPMTDQYCLTYAIARRSALTAGPSSSSPKLAIRILKTLQVGSPLLSNLNLFKPFSCLLQPQWKKVQNAILFFCPRHHTD